MQAKKSLQTDALKRLALSVVAAGIIVVGAFMLLFLCYCLLKKPESVNPGKLGSRGVAGCGSVASGPVQLLHHLHKG